MDNFYVFSDGSKLQSSATGLTVNSLKDLTLKMNMYYKKLKRISYRSVDTVSHARIFSLTCLLWAGYSQETGVQFRMCNSI